MVNYINIVSSDMHYEKSVWSVENENDAILMHVNIERTQKVIANK